MKYLQKRGANENLGDNLRVLQCNVSNLEPMIINKKKFTD